jgi:hypothetical protein
MNIGHFKLSENRIAWAKTSITTLALMRYTEDQMRAYEELLPGDEYEYGDTLRLLITTTTTGRPFSLNITAMTHDELVAFRDLINLTLEKAEPIVLERDRRAQEAYANGDDSFTRSYRQPPQYVVREGAVGSDNQGVHNRSENASDGKRGKRDSS